MTNENNKPKMDALLADEFESNGKKRTKWTNIGVAFEHEDGDGFTLQLRAFPTNGGKILLRKRKAADKPVEDVPSDVTQAA